MDRRLIKDRIAQLNRELKEVRQHREITRAKRTRNGMPVAAIVGYTNAGKSTLLNRLTDAGVLEEDKLFATLDPTTRVLELPGRQEILLTDTVGFIRKLPHHLVEAFKSTLEEVCCADILIHVVDSSSSQMEAQMQVVYETLRELGADGKPVITVFNKQDLLTERQSFRDFRAERSILSSAHTGQGLEELKDAVSDVLRSQKIYIERLYPYEKAGLIQLIRKKGELIEEKYQEDGIFVRAYVPESIYMNV